MKKYFKNFMKYRHLLVELVKKDVKLKYRRSYLGILWTLLEPLLTMIVLSVVFGTLFGKDEPTWPVYILTGRLLYSFFSNSTKATMKSIRNHGAMIKKVYVPKYIYPLSSTCSSFVTFLISLIVLVAVSIVLKVHVTYYVFLAIIPLAILFVLTYGVGMILATMSVFFRDLEYLWSVGLMMIMYTSAIFYESDRLIKSGYDWILKYNPVYAIILNFRNAVYYGQGFDTYSLVYSTGFSLVTLVIGLLLFYRKQDKFILFI
ncbi:ABC transporter permease [Anaeromicropila populeti]|uniref:Transport permease protein n=1 Tax=Anaeromicropila populeti TaxID=37658 RepID=A0A1I6HQX0_9FIRM|nr:ABC transporter permease [Anaeromicropila populeti]SFR56846.1 ABC-2 type transport system permease protein [Anaeromicropila populeti]